MIQSNTAASTTTTGAAFQIKPIDTSYQYIKILVYGGPGVGKTTLAGSSVDVSEMNKVLFIDIEAGTMVMNNNERVKNFDKIDVIQVKNFTTLVRVHEFLKLHSTLWKKIDAGQEVDASKKRLIEIEEKLTGKKSEKPLRYKTVIIDSISEADRLCLNEILGVANEYDITTINTNLKTPEYKEYNQNNNLVNSLLRGFRDLPMNVIGICAERYDKDELGRNHFMPSLTGKLKQTCQGVFDIVGYLQAGKANLALEEGADVQLDRRLHVVPTNQWDAKSRLAHFKKPFFVNPTMHDIMREAGLIK